MHDARQLFLEALDRARPLLVAQESSESWDRPSALRDMTVGALAAHLVRALTTVSTYLRARPPNGSPIPAAAYYTTVLPTGDLEDPVHVGIRERAWQESTKGHQGVVSAWDESAAEVRSRLKDEPDDRILAVAGGLVIRLDDYLVTRLIELVVHTDDLAVSVGLDTPNFDSSAMSLVLEHLVEVARLHHGDLAVVRAFTRKERDAVDALRVF